VQTPQACTLCAPVLRLAQELALDDLESPPGYKAVPTIIGATSVNRDSDVAIQSPMNFGLVEKVLGCEVTDLLTSRFMALSRKLDFPIRTGVPSGRL